MILDPRVYVTLCVLAAAMVVIAPIRGFDSKWFARLLNGGLQLFSLAMLAGLLDFIWSFEP